MLTDEDDLPIEDLLQVGMMVVVHTDPDYHTERRYRSFIRGWHAPMHIVIDRPQSVNRPAPLREEQPCVIRFAVEGRACAFDSHILDWDNKHEMAYCRIAWPQKFEIASFRKHQRIPVMIPCSIKQHDGRQVKGEILDISVGGCRIRTEALIDEGFEVNIDFTLPDGTMMEKVLTIVRGTHPVADEFLLGCQFADGQDTVTDGITFCIATMLNNERNRGIKHRAEHILIIDDDKESGKSLRQAFENEKWNVFTALNTLDGLMRLRLLPPAALLVNSNQHDLSGTEITRLVKSSPGFELLPIFVLGEQNHNNRENAIQAGASAFFEKPYNIDSICKQVINSAQKAIASIEQHA